MRSLWKLTLVQAKLYLREPMSVFFTLFFAPLLLVLFGFLQGNAPDARLNGRGVIDMAVPAYTGLIIATVGLMSVPIATAARREAGMLRRFRATPLRPLSFLAADVLVYFVMTLLGIVLLFLVGKIGYNVRFEGDPLSVLAGFCLGTFAFFALGYILAGLAPTARTAQLAGTVLFYPMVFISGATWPLEFLPQAVQNVARFIPLTYVVALLKGLWFGESWGEHLTDVAVLGATLVVGVIVAARTFRWE